MQYNTFKEFYNFYQFLMVTKLQVFVHAWVSMNIPLYELYSYKLHSYQ